MTFGYSSTLRDNGNKSGLENWAFALLDAVSSVRNSPSVRGARAPLLIEADGLPKERSRPIIFVCHSLGGLVAREVEDHILLAFRDKR
jgi:hypothetical protein